MSYLSWLGGTSFFSLSPFLYISRPFQATIISYDVFRHLNTKLQISEALKHHWNAIKTSFQYISESKHLFQTISLRPLTDMVLSGIGPCLEGSDRQWIGWPASRKLPMPGEAWAKSASPKWEMMDGFFAEALVTLVTGNVRFWKKITSFSQASLNTICRHSNSTSGAYCNWWCLSYLKDFDLSFQAWNPRDDHWNPRIRRWGHFGANPLRIWTWKSATICIWWFLVRNSVQTCHNVPLLLILLV